MSYGRENGTKYVKRNFELHLSLRHSLNTIKCTKQEIDTSLFYTNSPKSQKSQTKNPRNQHFKFKFAFLLCVLRSARCTALEYAAAVLFIYFSVFFLCSFSKSINVQDLVLEASWSKFTCRLCRMRTLVVVLLFGRGDRVLYSP